MDLDAYVDARHAWLVRTAVLLGCPPDPAAALVGQVLADEAGTIRRRDDPDHDVLVALHRAVLAERRPTSHAPDLSVEADDEDEDDPETEGLAVRRRLAALPADVRDVAVLVHGTDLGARRTAEALGLRARELPARAAAARDALGAGDGDDARRLVAAAAQTVRVAPPGPLPPAADRARDRRRPLGAAAILLALLALAGAISLVRPDDRPPGPRAVPALEELPRTLRGDQLPSLLGYRVPDALERLHDLSLVASVDRVDACEPPDVVLATSPGVGATFRMGDSVDVTAARRGAEPCAGYAGRVAAWAFLGFAAGRQPAPALAPRVTVVTDAGAPVVLTRARARSPRAWGPTLATVAEEVARVGVDASTYVTPLLTVRRTLPAARACGLVRPPSLGRRRALELALVLPTASAGCPLTVDLYRDAAGALDAVVVRGPRPRGTGTDSVVP